MKCSNPSCTRKAHQGRKKCFSCLVSNAKYMRYYRERRKLVYAIGLSEALGQYWARFTDCGTRGELGRVQGIQVEEQSNIGTAL